MARALALAEVYVTVALVLGCATFQPAREYSGKVTEYRLAQTSNGDQLAYIRVGFNDEYGYNQAEGVFPYPSREAVLLREVGTCVRVAKTAYRRVRIRSCRADEVGRW